MNVSRSHILGKLISFWLILVGSIDLCVAQECPVSVAQIEEFEGTLKSSVTHGWHGNENLAALIPADGRWIGMGASYNYRDKFWWWQKGFSARVHPDSALNVSATKLDGSGVQFEAPKATSGYDPNWDAMLVLMEFPSPGCWQVTGVYKGSKLTVTLEVGDDIDA